MKKAFVAAFVMACGESPVAVPDAAIDAGEIAEPDASITTSEDIQRSGTRIKMRVLTSGDGAKQFLGWHDTVRGDDCGFRLAADGVTRCLPFFNTAQSYYADAACTIPVMIAQACAPVPKYVGLSPPPSCTTSPTAGPKVFTRGATYTTAYQMSSTCQANAANANYVFYGLGVEVPAAEFEAGVEMVE